MSHKRTTAPLLPEERVLRRSSETDRLPAFQHPTRIAPRSTAVSSSPRQSTPSSLSVQRATEAVSEYRSGRELGYKSGLAAGKEASREEVEATISSLTAACYQLRAQEQMLSDQAADLAMELAVELAEAILLKSFEDDPTEFANYVVRQALNENIDSASEIVIRINPADAAGVDFPEAVTVRLDETVPRRYAEAYLGDGTLYLGVEAAVERVRASIDQLKEGYETPPAF